MEPIGIPSTRTNAYGTLLPPPPLWTSGILAAVRRVEHLEALHLVRGRSTERPSILPAGRKSFWVGKRLPDSTSVQAEAASRRFCLAYVVGHAEQTREGEVQ